VRLAMRRLLGEGRYRARAEELAAWAAENDGAAEAADLVEEAARSSLSGGTASTMRSASATGSVANDPR
jgi:hypothetical protein